MTIGEASKRTGLSVSAIRYYEKQGILREPKRTNEIRNYTENDISCMRYLVSLKSIDMPLREIKKYFDIKKDEQKDIDDLKTVLEAHKQFIEDKINNYQNVLLDINKKMNTELDNC